MPNHMPSGHEELIHFDRCIERMCSALNILKLVKLHAGHPLAEAAFRFAIIEYAASFTKSRGISPRRHKLSTAFTPSEHLQLHDRLLSSRDQVQAHTDIGILDAQLSVSEFNGQRLTSTTLKGITGLEELKNIDEIIALIDATVKNMLPERNRLKDAL